MEQDDMNKWAGIGAGIGFAVVFLRFLYTQAVYQSYDFGELILLALGGAFIGGIVGAVFCGIFSITKVTADSANSSFLKGVIYVIIPLIVCALADLVLLSGTFLFFPILSLITDGSLNGTYYSCVEWVVADVGSYCAD